MMGSGGVGSSQAAMCTRGLHALGCELVAGWMSHGRPPNPRQTPEPVLSNRLAARLHRLMETPAEELDETSRALVGCTTLWASPLTRALQTAMLSLQPLLEQDGAVLQLKQNARERKNWGGLDSIGTEASQRTRAVAAGVPPLLPRARARLTTTIIARAPHRSQPCASSPGLRGSSLEAGPAVRAPSFRVQGRLRAFDDAEVRFG